MKDDMENDKKHLFDEPKNVNRLLRFFYFCCLFLVILDLVINRHVYHSWESLWAFYPIYGFVSCVVLVVIASRIRPLLMRDENYYEQTPNAENRKTDPEWKSTEQPEDGISKQLGDSNVDD